jgi:HD-like signal output (HDOD) protein
MSKKRILFVDDEPLILQGLQRMLRSMRDEWEMVFVEGGEKALATMEQGPFDVVVTDMRMPVMNGAQLLREVRARHPRTVRLVLSGHADKELVAQCVGVAHQYISKPCDPEQLKVMVRNACLIGGDRVTDQVKDILGSIDRLPVVPATYLELERTLRDPDAGPQEVGAIIQRDMAMTAKVLKLVNSAFFGLRRTIASPAEAVTYLGFDTVKNLVLFHAIFNRTEPLRTRHLGLDDLWRHSLAAAQGAKAIAAAEGAGRETTETAYVGGLLQDMGILVLASSFPEAYDRVAEVVLQEHVLLTTAEQEEFAINHAEVGAYLLGLWGIPTAVLQIVAGHHRPQQIAEPGFQPELAVYAADLLVGELGGNELFRTGRFDLTTLERLGVAGRVDAWRQAVRDACADLGEVQHG